MKDKIEITDAMVARAIAAMNNQFSTFGAQSFGDGNTTRYVTAESLDRAKSRFILDAVLNPPLEPEITVTPEMALAGGDVLVARKGTGLMMIDVAAECYRAMRKLEPSREPLPDAGLQQRRSGNDRRVAPYIIDGTPMRRQGRDRRRDGAA